MDNIFERDRNGEVISPDEPRYEAWECHIEPDWLLVWEQNDTELTLLMIETGTHSDIFG